MMHRYFKTFFTSTILTTVLFFGGLQTVQAQDQTMIQGFYWDVTPNGVWYDTLSTQAAGLAEMGIDAVWFPPPSKGDGQLNVGYTPYDYYDLGEYDSQSGDRTSGTGAFVPTRYGTRAQLENAMEAFQSRGIEVYADIVVNHRSGGNLEPNPFAEYYTNRDGGSLFSPDGENTFTAFPLTHGSGRIAWDIGEGGEFFYPNAVRNPDNTDDFFADNQIDGFHQMYVNSFGYANALHDGDGSTLPVGDSLKVWGDWLSSEIGFDGYRIDFVKGVHPTYMTNWLNYGATEGRFHVHELFDGSLDRLKTYLDQISGTTRQGTVFDFNLRFAYKELSDQGDNYDIRNLLGRGLYYDGVSPDRIVTFVDNHDFDRLDYQNEINQEGHSPVSNLKIPIYAHMMALPPKATIWYRDMYWYGLQDVLTRMTLIRSNFISGAEYTNTAFTDGSGTFEQPFWPGNPGDDPRHMMVIQRTGIDNETGSIMAINKHSSREIEVWISNVKEEWNGLELYDISGNVEGTTQVFADGRVLVRAKPESYSAWVPLDYELDEDVSISLTNIEEPTGTIFIDDSFIPTVRVNNESLFSQSGMELSYEITQNGTTVTGDSQIVDQIPGSSGRSVQFDPFEISEEGDYLITFTIEYETESGTGQDQISGEFTVIDPASQEGIIINGTINEPDWVNFAQKTTNNAGFGDNKDVKGLYIFADNDSLYLAVDAELAFEGNNGDGIGIMLEFSELEGIPAGEPLGSAPGAVHFLNPGNEYTDFTMSFDVDLGISMSWAQQQIVLSMARYQESGNEGAVILSSTDAPGGDGEVGTGPEAHTGFLPENSVRYAFRESGNPETGLEIAIAKDALGISDGDVRAFGFIVSGTAFFSNVTVPGNVGGSNPGFSATFHDAAGGPFVSGWVSLADLEVEETVPSAPQLSEPVGGVAVDPIPDLKWLPVFNADTYQVQVADNDEFDGASILLDEVTQDTSIVFNEAAEQVYYWRVRAENEAGTGEWSSVESFRIGDDEVTPDEITLRQNYPNPFTAENGTEIEFDLPEQAQVRLEVFDMLGRRVAVLVDGVVDAGEQSVFLDTAGFASGVYIYRLVINGTTLNRKMTVFR